MLILVGMSLLSPWLVWRLELFRRPAVGWPVRFGPMDAVWRFLLLLIAAFVLTQAAGAVLYPLLTGLPGRQRVLAAGMLGSLIGFLAVLPLNAAMRADGTRMLGLSPRGILPGFIAGATWFIVVFPWIFWLMLAGNAALQYFYPEAPREHELFRMWQQPETTNLFRGIAAFTAVIVAPFFEELVFRGFLQTGIARLFTRWQEPVIWPPAPISPPPPVPLPTGGPLVLGYAPLPPSSPLAPSPAARWAAIIITSILFAAVHQPWTITIPIFLLALGLGIVYERRGNLWSAIFLHMLFNGFQFAMFLLIVSR